MADEVAVDTGGATEPAADTGTIADVLGKGEPEGEGGKPKAATKPKGKDEPAVEKPRYKYRRGEAEHEADGETLAKLLSDDGEHEFTGPGGKPTKMQYAELVRHAQLGLGASQRMREAAELRKRTESMLEEGKKDVHAYMQQHLGIEDTDEWIRGEARKLFERDIQIAELRKTDPFEAERRQRALVTQQLQRKDKLERAVKQREEEQRRVAEGKAAGEREAKAAFEKAGLPWNAETVEMARKAYRPFEEAGIAKEYSEIAGMVRKALHQARRAELERMKDEELPTFLGDKLRERLRALELAAAKVVKQEARGKTPEPPAVQPANGKGISEADILRRMRS